MSPKTYELTIKFKTQQYQEGSIDDTFIINFATYDAARNAYLAIAKEASIQQQFAKLSGRHAMRYEDNASSTEEGSQQ